MIFSGILERARGWGVRRPPLHYWGPFSPMFSKKMLNLKRERPPTSFFGKTPLNLMESEFNEMVICIPKLSN